MAHSAERCTYGGETYRFAPEHLWPQMGSSIFFGEGLEESCLSEYYILDSER